MACTSQNHAFLSWFSGLEPWSRIEVSVQLLHMHHPIELRFLGSVLEGLARKSSANMKPMEATMNDPNLILYNHDLLQPSSNFRANLTMAIALLKSNNTQGAARLFNHVLSLGAALQQWLPTVILNECLLIVMMAKYHPAFCFQSKNVFRELETLFLQALETDREDSQTNSNRESAGCSSEYAAAGDATESDPTIENCDTGDTCTVVEEDTQEKTNEINTDIPIATVPVAKSTTPVRVVSPCIVNPEPSPTVFCTGEDVAWDDPTFCLRCNRRHEEDDNMSRISSSVTSSQAVGTPPVYVTDIDTCIDRSKGLYRLLLKVKWSNDVKTEVSKKYPEVYDFHKKMLDMFPKAAGCSNSKRIIPYFPSCQIDGDSINEEDLPLFRKYMEGIMMLSPRMLGCPYVCEYFGLVISVQDEANVEDESTNYVDTNKCSVSLCNQNQPHSSITRNENKVVQKVDLRVTIPPLKQSSSLGDMSHAKDETHDEDEDSFRRGSVKSLVFHNSEIMPNDFVNGRENGSLSICTDSTQDDSSLCGDDGMSNECDRSYMSAPWSGCEQPTSSNYHRNNADLIRWRSTDSDKTSLCSKYDKQSRHFVHQTIYNLLRKHRLLAYRVLLSNYSVIQLVDMTAAQLESETGIPYDTCQVICHALKPLSDRRSNLQGRSESLNGMRTCRQRSHRRQSPRSLDNNSTGSRQDDSLGQSPLFSAPDRLYVGYDGDKVSKGELCTEEGEPKHLAEQAETSEKKKLSLPATPSDKKMNVALDVSVYENDIVLMERDRGELETRERALQEEYNRNVQDRILMDRCNTNMQSKLRREKQKERHSPRRYTFAAGDRYTGNRDKRDYNSRQGLHSYGKKNERWSGFGNERSKGGFSDSFRKGGQREEPRRETRNFPVKHSSYRDQKDPYVQPGEAGWLESEIEFPPMANEELATTPSSNPPTILAPPEQPAKGEPQPQPQTLPVPDALLVPPEACSAPPSISMSPPAINETSLDPPEVKLPPTVHDPNIASTSENSNCIRTNNTAPTVIPTAPINRPPPMPLLPQYPWYHYPPRNGYMDNPAMDNLRGRGRGKRVRMRPPTNQNIVANCNAQYLYSMLPPPNMLHHGLHMQHILQHRPNIQHGLMLQAMHTTPHTSEQLLQMPPTIVNHPVATPPLYNGQSIPVPPDPEPESSCCNCGGMGHTAVMCQMPNIDDITKDRFSLDLDLAAPDTPSEVVSPKMF